MQRQVLAGVLMFAASAGTLVACQMPPSTMTDDGSTAGARPMALVTTGAPWQVGQSAAGMAVDSKGRVHLADKDNVYVVDGPTVRVELTAAEAASTSGAAGPFGFSDLDIAPDDGLYILLSGTVVRSRAAHQAEVWGDISMIERPHHLGVIASDLVGLFGGNGFWTSSSSKTDIVYAQNDDGITCATEDLATAASGVFLYQTGCNGSPIVRGHADGSGVEILYDTDRFNPSPIHASNFLCAARDPSGGFYVVVEDVNEAESHLFHIAEDADGSTGLLPIPTRPSFKDAAKSHHEAFAFRFCSLAVGHDGTVFFQTYSQLWKIAP
jgi:hypothetical protein